MHKVLQSWNLIVLSLHNQRFYNSKPQRSEKESTKILWSEYLTTQNPVVVVVVVVVEDTIFDQALR